MARPRAIDVETDTDDDIKEQASELAALNAAEGGDLFAAIDELRSAAGVTCQVHRTAPEGKTGYCGSIPVAEFSRDKIKQLYGAGRYKVQIKGPKGYLPGGGPVEIAETIETSKSAPTDLASLLEIMDRRDRERAAEKSDKLGRIAELSIPILGSVLTAFISRSNTPDVATLITALRPAPGPSLQDLSAVMVNMQTLTAPKQSDRDPVDMVLRVMEAAQGLSQGNSKEKGETNWLDVVRDVIKEVGPAAKPVLDMLQARAAAQNPSSPPQQIQPAIPAPIPPAAPTAADIGNVEQTTDTTDMMALFKPMIKLQLAKIAKWAEDSKNPYSYADVFFDDLPKNISDYLPQDKALEYLNHEEWFKYVVEWEPRLANYRQWCDYFRQTLIDLLKPIEETTSESDVVFPPDDLPTE